MRHTAVVAADAPWLPSTNPALKHLKDLARLQADWDSYGAVPPTSEAIRVARLLIHQAAERLYLLRAEQIVPFAIMPVHDGGIQLDWRGPGRELEIEIRPTGSLRSLLVSNPGEGETYDERSTLTLQQGLDLIVPDALLVVTGSRLDEG